MTIWCYSGGFPDKVTRDIDFTDDVVQCDVPVVNQLVIYK